ncbi:MAG: N-acetyltransferase [Actinomycetota bacterium]|nr:N-acetyltransferase [Actinomycetota bacterium]
MRGAPLPDGAQLAVFTAEERPDLWEHAEASFPVVWPEYNLHGDVSNEYFSALYPQHAHVQVLVYDTERERVVARGRAIPFRWDGTLHDLPAGIDAAGLRALNEPAAPTALLALAAEVAPDQRGRGLSGEMLGAMAHAAGSAGLAPLLAPVRPTWKERYPLIPIEQYSRWLGDDGLPFDPWMRVHARMGATVLRPEPRSMRITGSVEQWEHWTGLAIPDDGSYVFPGGLAPLTVVEGTGRYWEPNVWMLHDVR